MNNETSHGEVILYQDRTGHLALDVRLSHETVWLSQEQMASLFERDRSVISKHIKNLFQEGELEEKSNVQTMQIAFSDKPIKIFSLDVIISVGYRVKSKRGTQFRHWASQVLKDHLIQGVTYHKKRLQEKGLSTFRKTLELLECTLIQQALVSDIGVEVLKLVSAYAKTWHLLLAYDEEKLVLPGKGGSTTPITYTKAKSAINALKDVLRKKGEASEFFGQERDFALEGILNNLEQTFMAEPLYQSAEEKSAHLLYFIIKDHPFIDGNKRIGSFLFLLYLEQQQLLQRIDDKGLVALALLVAESAPSQKTLLISLIANLLQT